MADDETLVLAALARDGEGMATSLAALVKQMGLSAERLSDQIELVGIIENLRTDGLIEVCDDSPEITLTAEGRSRAQASRWATRSSSSSPSTRITSSLGAMLSVCREKEPVVTPQPGIVARNVTAIGVNASVNLTITVQFTKPGNYSNIAAVASATTDPDAGNNKAITNTTVNPSSDTEPPTIRNATAVDVDGDRAVTDGDSITVSATVTDGGVGVDTVRADASAFGGGIVVLTDDDGDEIYKGTFTVDADRAAVNGSYAITLVANDTLNNTNTASTNELQLNTTREATLTPTPTPVPVKKISQKLDGFGATIAIVAVLLAVFVRRRRG